MRGGSSFSGVNGQRRSPSGSDASARKGIAATIATALCRPALCLALLLCPTGSALAAAGETVTYPGAALQDIPTLGIPYPDSLAPSGSHTGKSGSLSNNSVTLNAPGALNAVFGGVNRIDAAAVTNNQVFIRGGTAESDVYGGASLFGKSVNNTVTVTGGIIRGFVVAGQTAAAAATGNRAVIAGGEVRGAVFAAVSDTSVTGNEAFVSGGSVGDAVYGGGSVWGSAAKNTATVSGGTVGNIVAGGYSFSGAVTDNRAAVSGGTVRGSVFGGYSGGAATGNTVTVSGGTVRGDVLGGISVLGDATGNTVTISGSPVLTSAVLCGGLSDAGDARTGNSLNLRSSGMKAAGIANFASYNFYLPSSMQAGRTVLTASRGDGAGGMADISNSLVAVGVAGGKSALQPGDRVTLIHSGTGLIATGVNNYSTGVAGVASLYDFYLHYDADNLYATAISASANPQLKALSEGRLAGLAFVGQGADLIIGPGMYSALLATQRQGAGLAPFAVAGGGHSRYNTGSRVDVDGFSMMAGLAWRAPLAPKSGAFLAGGFFEAGWGNYDAYNSFSSLPTVEGEGNTNYYGGGLMARYEAPFGAYADASLRAGQVRVDFSSDDILNGAGKNTDYDSGSAYYGASAGLGYIWKMNEKASLDFSTRYIWTHQNSDSVSISGDRIRFKAADSQRWRSGARFVYAANENVSPYAGAYFDHEFDGGARATANGLSIKEPDLRGDTASGELGLTLTPFTGGALAGLSFDLGLQGYVGVREGVTGSLRLKWDF